MAPSKPSLGILYQNAGQDVTLIDIPTSIAAATGIPGVLLSREPLEKPFIVENEPKTEKAKTNAANNTVPEELHKIYVAAIDKALAEVRQHVMGAWCLPRKILPRVEKSRAKGDARMQVDSDPEEILSHHLHEWSKFDSNEEVEPQFDFQAMMTALVETGNVENAKPSSPKWVMSYRPINTGNHAHGLEEDPVEEPLKKAFYNKEDVPLELTIYDTVAPSDKPFKFMIPARSTYYLCDGQNITLFRNAFKDVTQENGLPRRFDFILLDPPWPNRSLRHAGAYKELKLTQLKRMLLQLSLHAYLENNGLFGIWITNKPAVRDVALKLLEKQRINLIEEWIWLKTTIHGEPELDISSLWRKPYEVLLLGRLIADPNDVVKPENVKRRVIVGVPDVHSRKPCLKELVRPFMKDPEAYGALEIFGRGLVEGWSTCGDEALKFNWEGYWGEDRQV